MKDDKDNYYAWYCYDPDFVRKRFRFKPGYYYRKIYHK